MAARSEKLHKKFNISVGLVHGPVVDRAGEKVCTNITNFDIHDIARVSRSVGVRKYYLINSLREQLMFADRVLDHWKTGYGKQYNPMRSTALNMIETTESVEEAIERWHKEVGLKGLVVATAARDFENLPNFSFRKLREKIEANPGQPILILFGTGFGLHEDVLKLCDALIEPIRGASGDDYRHLSVRTAVSICLDRLFGLW